MISIRQVVAVLVVTASALAQAEPTAAKSTPVGSSDMASRGEALDAQIQLQLRQAELASGSKADGLQASCVRHSLDLVPRLRQTVASALASLRVATSAGDRPNAIVQLAQLDAAAKEATRLAGSVGHCLGARDLDARAVASASSATRVADDAQTSTQDSPPPPPAKVERKQARVLVRDRDFGRCEDLLGVIACAMIPLEYVGFASPHFP